MAHHSDMQLIWLSHGHEDALEKCLIVPPDVLVIGDLGMKLDILYLLRRIKDTGIIFPIVVLGSKSKESAIEEFFQMGANAFLDDSVDWDQLIVVIRKVANGTVLIPRKELRETQDRLARLTHREREVLRLLAQGYANQEIANALYISQKTVKNHLTNLFRKLEVKDRTQAVLHLLLPEFNINHSTLASKYEQNDM